MMRAQINPRRTLGSRKHFRDFFESSCHNFLRHDRCCRLGWADEHIAVRFTPFWSRSPGRIPLEKEFIDPETCSMQKALKMILAARRWLQRKLRDFYHLSCLCGMRNLRTRHIWRNAKNAMSKYFNFMQNKFRRLSLKRSSESCFRSFSTQI